MVHETRFRVRYAETDQLGMVYHSNHIIWFEMGRTAFLRDLGIPYSRMEEMGVACPVVELGCRYRNPARFEDELVIRTAIQAINPVKISFGYEIVKAETGLLVATGETVHAFFDIAAKKPLRMDRSFPDIWRVLVEAAGLYRASRW